MKNFPKNLKGGVTLVELLVSVGIFLIIAIFIASFQRDIFSFNTHIQKDLNAQIEGRRAVVSMVKEMREMSPSSLGSYAIAQAATSSVTFYSNIDADAYKEQIRYYVQGGKLLKSVIKPSGSPLVYNAGSAVVTTVVSDFGNGTSTPLFQYYDSNYSGTSTPLSVPINIASVKLIKFSILLNRKSSQAQSNIPLSLTSQVVPRNLKDNL